MQVSMGTGGGGAGATTGADCGVTVPPVCTDFCDVMLVDIEREATFGSGGRGASGSASIISGSLVKNLQFKKVTYT